MRNFAASKTLDGGDEKEYFCPKKILKLFYLVIFCAPRQATSLHTFRHLFMRVMTHPIGESARGVCACASLHISPMWDQKLSEELQVKRTRGKQTATEGDEDLPKPKSGRASRSLQQCAQTQQRRRESSQLRQHHPDLSPANPHHPSLL